MMWQIPMIYRLKGLSFLIGLLLLLFPQKNWGQLAQPFESLQDWQVVRTENFDVFAPRNQTEGAELVARFAELARYELGILYDYSPTERFTLLYTENPLAFMQTNLRLNRQGVDPGEILLPRKVESVIHPGTTQALYQEVKRAVSDAILKQFSYGDQLGTSIQTELLLYDAKWFYQGLSSYVSSGWTYEDEQWMGSLTQETFSELAMEGDSHVQDVIRRSLWHFITHEYGEQKVSEIVYLVTISHSIESGIISVLGITLNILTIRWERYMNNRLKSTQQGRTFIEDYGDTFMLVPPEGAEVIGFDYHEGQDQFAVYLNRSGKLSVQLYDPVEKKWSKPLFNTGYSRNDVARLDFSLPVRWAPDGKSVIAPIWKDGSMRLMTYDLEEGELQESSLPRGMTHVLELNYSPSGEKIALSGLHNGAIDIYIQSGSSSWKQLTDDAYDDLDPIWRGDEMALYFSSNRPMHHADDPDQIWSAYKHATDLYQLTLLPDTTILTQITETPNVDERKPMLVDDVDLLYISNAAGIHNLEKLGVLENRRYFLSDYPTGIIDFRVSNGEVVFSEPIEGKVQLMRQRIADYESLAMPEPTLLRLAADAKFKLERLEEAEKEAEEALEVVTVEDSNKAEPAQAAQPEEVENEENDAPVVKYYIFDDEESSYEKSKADRNQFESPTRPKETITTTVFGKVPAPVLAELEVSQARRQRIPWTTEKITMGMYYDPVSKFGINLGATFSDILNHHELEVLWRPSIRFSVTPNDHLGKLTYTYKPRKIDYLAEATVRSRFLNIGIEANTIQLDSLLFRYNHLGLDLGARYPLSSFTDVTVRLGAQNLSRLDQRLSNLVLLNNQSTFVHGGIQARFDNVTYIDKFEFSGLKAEVNFDHYQDLSSGGMNIQRLKAELRYYRPVLNQSVLAVRLGGGFTTPRNVSNFYLGGTNGQVHAPIPISFVNPGEGDIRTNEVDTALNVVSFLDFVNPMRGFRFNTRAGSRYLAGNVELRIPISRLLRYSLQGNTLYNIEIIPFVDAGTVWTEGNPFSQKKPTDTRFITSGNVRIKLQTLKSPFLIGFGSGLRANLLAWSVRVDFGWGIDDYTLLQPTIHTSLSRSF
ncbi:MAG: BamA/TamA family outer membrane protein [Bacteroidota bacterium]